MSRRGSASISILRILRATEDSRSISKYKCSSNRSPIQRPSSTPTNRSMTASSKRLTRCAEQSRLSHMEFSLNMKKRNLAVALSLAVALPACAQTVSKKAREIQASAIVIDTHADTPQRFLDENYDIGSTDPKDPGHISLDKAKTGGLGAEFFSIWVEPEANTGHFAHRTLDLIDSVYEQAARHPD